VLAAVALVASAILLVDYVRPAPVFCDAGGGCEKVRETVFAKPLGIPLPGVGLSGMLAIALAALVPGRLARIAQLVLSGVAALAAVVLLAVQARMRTICPFCAIVDGASIALVALAFVRFRKELDPPSGRRIPAAAVVALLAAIALPLAIGFHRRALPRNLPGPIAEEMRKTGPGKVTVVDFADFECPYCRRTHAALAPLLESRRDKVRVARKHVPLRMHPHAMDAAKAACCGEALGKTDEMADALFQAKPDELTPEGCEAIAKKLGLDVDRFRACVGDPATLARIEKDREAYRAAKAHGLPTIWVDGTVLPGQQDAETLRGALDDAIRAL
jgi:predicted DsbA family dithiol-disulfide isomerase/uncharacterized membrane protein